MTRNKDKNVVIVEESEELKQNRDPRRLSVGQRIAQDFLTWQQVNQIIKNQGDNFIILEPVKQKDEEKVYLRGAKTLIENVNELINKSSQLFEGFQVENGELRHTIEEMKKGEAVLWQANSELISLKAKHTALQEELGQTKYELAEKKKRMEEQDRVISGQVETIQMLKQNPIYQHEQQVNQNLNNLRTFVEQNTPSSWMGNVLIFFIIAGGAISVFETLKKMYHKITAAKNLDDMKKDLDHLPKKNK